MANYLSSYTGAETDSATGKSNTLLTPAVGNFLYHSGNTGIALFNTPPPASGFKSIVVGSSTASAQIDIMQDDAGGRNAVVFGNPNGTAGSIGVLGAATSYNTSSDPRLKNFAEAPTDEEINTEFNKVFSSFRVFNWKTDPEGDLVWGFDAHACIDAGTDIGSEGEGSRDLEIGAVYETTPAVTESRVIIDAEGNPTNEIEEVVITPAVEKKVTPAGVDQSKAVPILLAKIEQLERRLSAANL